MGATNTLDRVAAMMGEINEAPLDFEASESVPNGGVLFALPALLSIGLLHNTQKYFHLPKGYYGLFSIFLLLAFMALARIKSVERLKPVNKGVENHNLNNKKTHIFSKIWGFVLWEIFPASFSTLSRRYS